MSQLFVDNIKGRTGGAIGAPSGVNATGVVTATTFSGNVTGVAATFSGNVNISGTLTYEDVTNIDSAGIITAAQGIRVGAGQSIGSNSGTVYYYGDVTGNATGLSGTPDITVGSVVGSALTVSGISSLTDLRLASIADKTTIVDGNTVSLAYSSGGGNVAICTNPSGAITLNVTSIPTTSDFDNRAISFAIIVQQGTTAYACTAVTLNGVAFGADATVGLQTHIAYSAGTVATGSTSSYDTFNFTGINTVGSASTTTNYKLLSNVNGDYRLY